VTWTPDNKNLIIFDRETPSQPMALSTLSLETGEKRLLATPPAKHVGDAGPAVSPDGRTLAFIRSPSYAVGDLWAMDLAADFAARGEPRRLTFDQRSAAHPAWTPDSRDIVFVSNRLGGYALWRIPASGRGPLQPLPSVGADASSVAISRQGNRLSYSRSVSGRDIFQVTLPDRSGAAPGIKPLIASTRDDHAAHYSPDGKKIVWSSERSGHSEIWLSDRDGSSATPLTSFGGPRADQARWSPDGRRIAFHGRPEGHADIFVINAEGGRLQRLTREQGDDVSPSWSLDGKWIYFGSARSGDLQIWKIPAEGGGAVQVTRNGGIAALEAPDGSLYLTKTRGVTALCASNPAAARPRLPIHFSTSTSLSTPRASSFFRLRAPSSSSPSASSSPAPSLPSIPPIE